MTKKLALISLVLGTVLFTGCGSSGSKSNESKEESFSDKVRDANTTSTLPECATSGKTVLVDEGTICIHKATSARVSCKDNKVSVGGITATEVNILRHKFICQ